MRSSVQNIFNTYFRALGITEGFDPKNPAHMVLFRRSTREVNELIKMSGDDATLAQKKIVEISSWAKLKGLDWSLSTIIKRWFSDNTIKVLPQTYAK